MANIHNYFDITIPVEYLNKHLNTHYKGEVYIEGTYEVTEIELYPESTIHTESITIGIDKFSIDGIDTHRFFYGYRCISYRTGIFRRHHNRTHTRNVIKHYNLTKLKLTP